MFAARSAVRYDTVGASDTAVVLNLTRTNHPLITRRGRHSRTERRTPILTLSSDLREKTPTAQMQAAAAGRDRQARWLPYTTSAVSRGSRGRAVKAAGSA